MKIELQPPVPDESLIRALQDKVYRHYAASPRPLPWRDTHDPYAILVSEIMLQQTTVERVLPKYLAFLERFPNIAALAAAPLQEVMTLWQGLGYNRRGLALKRAAEDICTHHDCTVPKAPDILKTLPGIGPYTAAAVAVFAFRASLVLIETNIRTVFIHEFFPSHQSTIRDKELLPLIAAALDESNPREWYYALMDYGVMLKKMERNPSRRSAHYSRQTPFKGSRREMRSRILRIILNEPGCTLARLSAAADVPVETVLSLVEVLGKEGLITQREGLLYV